MDTQDKQLDPRIIRSRRAFQQALIDLIPEKGYGQISVKDIAHRAGLNRTTFYLHYQNKDDLLASGFETVWEELISALPLVSLQEGDAPTHLSRAALMNEFRRLEKLRSYYQALLGRQGAPHFKLRLQDYLLNNWRELLEGSQLPILESELSRKAVLAYLSSAYLGLLDWWLDADGSCSPEEMTDLFRMILSLRPCDMIGIKETPGKDEGAQLASSGGKHDRIV